MRTEKIQGHKVKIYDSIEELPIKRYHKYMKYLIIDSGIGSDINDINGHFFKAIRYVKDNPDLAVLELENLQQSLLFAHNEISPKMMAFSALIDEIDEIKRDDLSDEGLKETMGILSEMKYSLVTGFLESVKKKIDSELSLYFQGKFESAIDKEFKEEVRKRALFLLDEIINDKNNESQIGTVEKRLLDLIKPTKFTGSNGFEVMYDKTFEENNLLLTKNLSVDIDKITVLQYYTAIDHLKSQNKKK